MNFGPPLSGSHLRTYETIFQHPLSHNLNWREVHALLRHLGQLEEQPNGNFKVTRNGQTLLLHAPKTKDVANADEVMTLRHFLQKSEVAPAAPEQKDLQCLLVIDHHQARIFNYELHAGTPHRILPEELFRHTRDSGNVSRGREKPDPDAFFKPVAEALKSAGRILVMGTGTGMSSEMDQFVAWMKIHHPDQAARIIGSLAVDEKHLTNDQLLAKARDFYANATAV